MRDSRWAFLPLIILRPKQLLLSIIILGLTGFIVSSWFPFWWASIALFTALVSLLWSIICISLYYTNHLLPFASVIVDAFLTLFWLISFAGTASTGLLSINCNFDQNYDFTIGDTAFWGSESFTNTACLAAKGAFGLEFIAFLSLVISLVLSALTLHRTRHDLFGQEHATGVDANEHDGDIQQQTVVAMYPVGKEPQQPAVYYTPAEEVKTSQFTQQPVQATYYPEPPTPTQGHMDTTKSSTIVEEVHNISSYSDISRDPTPRPVHEAPVSHTPAPGPELQS